MAKINNIRLFSQQVKFNPYGNVLKYITVSKIFNKISEVYFSEIFKNKIKAWKKNKNSDQFLYVFLGKIQIVIYDDRNIKNKKLNIHYVGEKMKYSKIYLPKNVWYGFKGLNQKNIIVNALKLKHEQCKTINMEKKNKLIPYIWK